MKTHIQMKKILSRWIIPIFKILKSTYGKGDKDLIYITEQLKNPVKDNYFLTVFPI